MHTTNTQAISRGLNAGVFRGEPSNIKQIDDGLRKAREITERCDNRRAWQKISLYERYLWGDVELGIGFAGEPQCECLVFGVSPSFISESGRRPPAEPIFQIGLSSNADETRVLSHNVHLMEREECVVPSFVRLERFDFCNVWGRKPLYLFAPVFVESIDGSGDRKINMVHARHAIATGACYRKNVKRASQSVDDHASVDINEPWRIGNIDFERIHSALRIELFSYGIRVSLNPSADLGIKNLHLGYGPIDAGL